MVRAPVRCNQAQPRKVLCCQFPLKPLTLLEQSMEHATRVPVRKRMAHRDHMIE